MGSGMMKYSCMLPVLPPSSAPGHFERPVDVLPHSEMREPLGSAVLLSNVLDTWAGAFQKGGRGEERDHSARCGRGGARSIGERGRGGLELERSVHERRREHADERRRLSRA